MLFVMYGLRMTRLIEQFFDLFSRITGIMMEQRIFGALVIMTLFATLAVLANFLIYRVSNYIGKKSNVEIDRSVFGGIHIWRSGPGDPGGRPTGGSSNEVWRCALRAKR
jgi:hypothetical protein